MSSSAPLPELPTQLPTESQNSAALLALLQRAETLLTRVEALLPSSSNATDWNAALAFRWRRSGNYGNPAGANGQGRLQPIKYLSPIRLADLTGIDGQKARVQHNTAQFVAGRPANNVLLTGSRGSGKSSIVKALLNEYATQGLRLIEVDKDDLVDLPDIVDLLGDRPERFIIFCDDLSFEAGESAYKALKVVLDGSLAATPDKVLIYATSNRRHLMPEYFAENLDTKLVDGEVHPSEVIEEKISLSDRFGLWVSFYPFSQDDYLNIVAHWLRYFGASAEDIAAAERDALNWSLGRGSRTGRVAWQFARDWAGQQQTKQAQHAQTEQGQ